MDKAVRLGSEPGEALYRVIDEAVESGWELAYHHKRLSSFTEQLQRGDLKLDEVLERPRFTQRTYLRTIIREARREGRYWLTRYPDSTKVREYVGEIRQVCELLEAQIKRPK